MAEAPRSGLGRSRQMTSLWRMACSSHEARHCGQDWLASFLMGIIMTSYSNIPIVIFLMVNIGKYTYVESYVCIFLLVNIGIAIVIYV